MGPLTRYKFKGRQYFGVPNNLRPADCLPMTGAGTHQYSMLTFPFPVVVPCSYQRNSILGGSQVAFEGQKSAALKIRGLQHIGS